MEQSPGPARTQSLRVHGDKRWSTEGPLAAPPPYGAGPDGVPRWRSRWHLPPTAARMPPSRTGRHVPTSIQRSSHRSLGAGADHRVSPERSAGDRADRALRGRSRALQPGNANRRACGQQGRVALIESRSGGSSSIRQPACPGRVCTRAVADRASRRRASERREAGSESADDPR